MSHAVMTEAREVFRRQKVFVADFHAVAEIVRERGEKRIQLCNELRHVAIDVLRENAELQNQYGDLIVPRAQQVQEHRLEHQRIEERQITLSGARAVSRVLWKRLNSDL